MRSHWCVLIVLDPLHAHSQRTRQALQVLLQVAAVIDAAEFDRRQSSPGLNSGLGQPVHLLHHRSAVVAGL